MAMIACTPCLLAPVKAGAAVLAGALGFSKLRKLSKKKKRKRNKKTQRGGRKRTNKKRTSKKKQNGGGEMTQEEYDEMMDYNDRLFKQYSNEERELQRDCRKHLREGINVYQKKNIFDKYKALESNVIKENCDKDKTRCRECIDFKNNAYAAKGIPPSPPFASQPFSFNPKTRSQLGESRSMRFRAADNTNFIKKMKAAKRSQHLRDTLNSRRHSRNKIRNLRKTRSASFGGGKKTKRRTRKLKR
jgi:hypothetical protein